jgi:hypothetical protein
MTAPADYTVVFGRGLEHGPDGSWDVSPDTQRRIDTAIEVSRVRRPKAFILIGGHPPQPRQPADVVDAERMERHLTVPTWCITDASRPSHGIVNGAINLAQITMGLDIDPLHDRLWFVAGASDFRYIARLSRLALGLDEQEAAGAFYHIPVKGEDGVRRKLRKDLGYPLLDAVVASVDIDAPADDRFRQLQAASHVMDEWRANALGSQTVGQVASQASRRFLSLYGQIPPITPVI